MLKGIFSDPKYVCVLKCQFEVSSMILTSFRQRRGKVIPPPPHQTAKKTPKKPTQIRVKVIQTVFNAFKTKILPIEK